MALAFSRRQWLAGSIGAAWSSRLAAATATQADRILIGRVRALDEKNTVGEAIAIAGDRVLAVGSRAAVLRTRGASTTVREVGGGTIIPGFNDAHSHLEREGLKTLRPSLAGARSIADVLRRVEEIARATPAGQWIVTMPVGEAPYYFGGPAVRRCWRKSGCRCGRSWIARRRIIRFVFRHPLAFGGSHRLIRR